MKGIIIKALSGFYYVCCENKIYECRARGNFRIGGISPLVGDYAEITVLNEKQGSIDKIYHRKNELSRPRVANIDKLFIISSFATPAPNTSVIDRLTAIAVYNDIEPIIVFNKCDMGDFTQWVEIYNKTGFKTLVVSADTGEGIENIKKELEGCVSAFTGNSGVGKSSLLNRLFGGLNLETGDVSQKLGRGRHTTRHIELFAVNGGYVADTPGFSSIETDNDDYDFKEALAECFPEFSGFAPQCRFTGCSHTCEKGCAVIEAVNKGEISRTRHNSYKEIFEQLKELKPWQTSKKRKK